MQERASIRDTSDKHHPFNSLNKEQFLALSEIERERYLYQGLLLKFFVHPIDGPLVEGKKTRTFGYRDEILPAYWHWNEVPGEGGVWVKASDRPAHPEPEPRQMTEEEADEFDRTDRYGGMYRS